MNIAPAQRYESSIKKLFPQGEWWDRQFSDPESDVSLFVKAKLGELLRFRQRMSELLDESRIETSSALLGDWERARLGAVNHGLDTEQRRGVLQASGADSFNIETIKKTGRLFGVTVTDVSFPYRPAFFGHCRFGADRLSSPAAFSVLFVKALPAQEGARREFERQLSLTILAKYITHFIYGGD